MMKEALSMKERLLFTCKIFGVALSIVVVSFLALVSPLLARGITPPCIVPMSYHITRMHWIEKRGEMGWNGDVEDAVKHLAQCVSDKERLARRLLSDSSGTIVSLGMDLIVREALDDGDRLLLQHFEDRRWNHNLTFNDEYARLLLAMWRMKKNIPLTPEDTEAMGQWPIEYFEGFDVVPPAGSYWVPS